MWQVTIDRLSDIEAMRMKGFTPIKPSSSLPSLSEARAESRGPSEGPSFTGRSGAGGLCRNNNTAVTLMALDNQTY